MLFRLPHLAFLATVSLLFALGGCRQGRQSPPPGAPGATAAAAVLAGPADSLIPEGPMGASIRRGRAILLATRDSLPKHVGNALACTNCHLDAGRRESGSWVGVHARYPQYRARSNIVETMEYRINDCFRRSMNGAPLDPDDPAMRDIMAYFAFLSRGVPVGPAARPAAGPWPQLKSDPTAGAAVFAASCAKCHAPDGEGTPAGPPVWGARSYNIGAGMARVFTAASFIRKNMPFDQPGTLTDQQALDVAAYVNGHPRPDFKGKEHDWPAGGTPPDVAYHVLSMDTSSPPAGSAGPSH
jgi:thiosulfate dehydrogenase